MSSYFSHINEVKCEHTMSFHSPFLRRSIQSLSEVTNKAWFVDIPIGKDHGSVRIVPHVLTFNELIATSSPGNTTDEYIVKTITCNLKEAIFILTIYVTQSIKRFFLAYSNEF